jgi:hypothetical protein
MGKLHPAAQLGGLAHGVKNGLEVKGWHIAVSFQQLAISKNKSDSNRE